MKKTAFIAEKNGTGYPACAIGHKLPAGAAAHDKTQYSVNVEDIRINKKYAYIRIMKTRLNLTIDETLLNQIKAYAASKHTSVSELVENYFKCIARPLRKKNILQLVEKLESPAIGIDPEADLKELFYKEQSGRYGF